MTDERAYSRQQIRGLESKLSRADTERDQLRRDLAEAREQAIRGVAEAREQELRTVADAREEAARSLAAIREQAIRGEEQLNACYHQLEGIDRQLAGIMRDTGWKLLLQAISLVIVGIGGDMINDDTRRSLGLSLLFLGAGIQLAVGLLTRSAAQSARSKK